MRKIILILFLSLISLIQISCQKNDRKAILIITVDELTINDVNCNRDEDHQSGLQLICKESVRFTHAFTPSILTVPALTSLLTGTYPLQHKVHHNGAPGASAALNLASEVAFNKEYRTSFISGGAPVFRRSGLNQGFELFDDSVEPGFKYLYRPFEKSVDIFKSWINTEVGNLPYFSLIYVPDLLFTTTETTSNLGELRSQSYESQLEEFDEHLFELITYLKEKKLWDKTTVILAGLNGKTDNQRPRQHPNLNLHNENTQVALFMKPSLKRSRDEAINWKIDQNISLADVGATLFDLLDSPLEKSPPKKWSVASLRTALNSSEMDLSEDRPILMESGWASWRNAGPIKIGAISNHVLYLNFENPLLYNTLVDRQEMNPLPLLQQSILPTTKLLRNLIHEDKLPFFSDIPTEWKAKLSISFATWTNLALEKELLNQLKRLSSRYPASMDLANWTAQIALRKKDWVTLKNLGQKQSVSNWVYVANKNLGIEEAQITDSCLLLIDKKPLTNEDLKSCNDLLFLEWIDWLRYSARGLDRDTQKKRFERSFKNYLLDQRIQRFNIAASFIWDTSRENNFSPSRVELALSLPNFEGMRLQIGRALFGTEVY